MSEQFVKPGKEIVGVSHKGTNVLVAFADGGVLELPVSVCASHYLYVGKVLSSKEETELLDELRSQPLLEYGLSLLRRGSYSQMEMYKKLLAKAKNDKALTIKVLDKLTAEGFCDDRAFAVSYVEEREGKGYGKERIVGELSLKGISNSIIDELKFGDQLSLASMHLPSFERKFAAASLKEKEEKAYMALIRLGFSSSVSRLAVSSLNRDSEKEENNRRLMEEKAYRLYHRKYNGKELSDKIREYLWKKGFRNED